MDRVYRIELDALDMGQLLDGLEIRTESWEQTADFFRTGQMPGTEFFMIEECRDAEEADGIARHYRSIIHKIRKQMEVRP